MTKLAWAGVAAFVAGIGCLVAGVLLSPKQVPGAPRVELGPLPFGLLLAAGVLVLLGGRLGLYPLIRSGVMSGKIPSWVLLLFLLLVGGAAVAYLLLHPEH
jgi:hypothetical protein